MWRYLDLDALIIQGHGMNTDTKMRMERPQVELHMKMALLAEKRIGAEFQLYEITFTGRDLNGI